MPLLVSISVYKEKKKKHQLVLLKMIDENQTNEITRLEQEIHNLSRKWTIASSFSLVEIRQSVNHLVDFQLRWKGQTVDKLTSSFFFFVCLLTDYLSLKKEEKLTICVCLLSSLVIYYCISLFFSFECICFLSFDVLLFSIFLSFFLSFSPLLLILSLPPSLFSYA